MPMMTSVRASHRISDKKRKQELAQSSPIIITSVGCCKHERPDGIVKKKIKVADQVVSAVVSRPRKKKPKNGDDCPLSQTISLWWNHDFVHEDPMVTLSIIPQLPKHLQMYAKNMIDFFLFIHERHKVWERRNQGLAFPWSKNPIFADFHMCNVYRELDRGTCFFRAHVLDLKASMNDKNNEKRKKDAKNDVYARDWIKKVLWSSYVYRQANKVESFMKLGFPTFTTLSTFLRKMKLYQNGSSRFFTAAHQTTHHTAYANYLSEVAKRPQRLLDGVVETLFMAHDTKTCLKGLQNLPGLGTFLAWQVLCDLREAGCLAILDDFCELGPGAKAGLSDIFGKLASNSASSGKKLELAHALVHHHQSIYETLGIDFSYWDGRPLTIKEIEHALCEYNKFKRIQSRAWDGSKISMRRRTTRSDMDLHSCCGLCKTNIEDGSYCDTCNAFYCGKCIPPADSVSYICDDCRKLTDPI